MADLLTTVREIWSYARTMVEVDLSKPLLDSLDIHLSNSKTFKQKVEYKRLPFFCDTCRQIGYASSPHSAKESVDGLPAFGKHSVVDGEGHRKHSQRPKQVVNSGNGSGDAITSISAGSTPPMRQPSLDVFLQDKSGQAQQAPEATSVHHIEESLLAQDSYLDAFELLCP